MNTSKLQTRTVIINGKRVNYQVAGRGTPIIFVHGLSGSMHWWIRNAPHLAQAYRVYVVDLPGFGSMRFPRSRFVLEEATSWLLQWMEVVGIQRAHLIGHSMGGYICIRIAARRPEVVERLILVSPAILPHVRNVFEFVVPLLSATRQMTPLFFPVLVYDALRANPLTILQTAHTLLAQMGDIYEDMHVIGAPTLLIWGEQDTLVPPEIAPLARKALKHSRLFFIRQAGHVSMFDRPVVFNEVVMKFLQGEAVGE